MKSYTITRVDGRPDWEKIPSLEISEQLWRPRVEISAEARIAWDSEQLYIRLSAKETWIRAEHTGTLGMPCEDSCLEFFFSPAAGDPRYFNLEYNPNASLYLGIGDGKEAIRLLPERDWFGAHAEYMPEGWQVEYTVPFSFIRFFFPGYRPEKGMEIRANCYKCGDLTRSEHYLAWNPCTGDTPDFHRPQDFGRMILG